MRLRAQCKSLVVGCHYEIYARHLFPKQSCRKVNSIEGARSSTAASMSTTSSEGDDRQDRRSPLRDLRARKVRPQLQRACLAHLPEM